jgi:hypothetical protein
VTHQEAVATLATERYLLDDMPRAEREGFEDHFFACAICADDLRVAAAMLQGAKAGFAGTGATGQVVPMIPRPAVRKPVWYRSAALPWAAAAALAVVTTYQSAWVVPSLRRGASPVAIVPVSLRPASRGAEAAVPLPADGAPVSLAIEINEPAESGQLAYTLTTSDGRQVASGRAAAPAPGTPLLLLIPSRSLTASMHYTLSIHDAGSSNRLLGEYRFAASPR